jgi:hypothetical protein
MFAVVFEVQPKAECRDAYLELAKHLKPLLQQIEGFVDNERFATSDTRDRAIGGTRSDATGAGRAKVLTVTEFTLTDSAAGKNSGASLESTVGLTRGTAGLVDSETFASLYTPGKLLLLASWTDKGAANAFAPRADEAAKDLRHRKITVIRDYGMRDRREAPQYFAAVE